MKFQLAILPGAFAPAIAASIVRGCVTHEGFTLADFILRPQAWSVCLAALMPEDRRRHLVGYGGVLSSAVLAAVCLTLILTGGMPW